MRTQLSKTVPDFNSLVASKQVPALTLRNYNMNCFLKYGVDLI
jgi:hypothetical protein